jgi:hypothetical protein
MNKQKLTTRQKAIVERVVTYSVEDELPISINYLSHNRYKIYNRTTLTAYFAN